MINMQGRTAVVFGVANKRSIAWAIAQRLQAAGVSLAITYQNERLKEEAQDLIASLPRAEGFQCDANNDAEIERLASELKQRYERIDVLAHLVGGFSGGTPVVETGDGVVDRMLDLNFRSAFHIIRAVLPHMRQQGFGRILAIGSKAAVEPAPMAAAYAASKAALVSFIRTVARENSDRGITANVVLPGTMDTPANRASDPTADISKWVNPCQVASLLVHLASSRASNINGAVIPVYGAEA